MSAPDPVIVLDDVTKYFGDVVAVSEVSCTIGPGVTSLLGPNGAGKSTVLRMLCGLTTPSTGRVTVLGRDPRADPGVARRMGLVPQQDGVFESLTAHGFVRLAAVLQGVPEPDEAAVRALGLVALDPHDPRHLLTYSKGMRQRVKIAQALVHDPDVVVLDEPLTGLDPRQRLAMVALLARMGAEGRCVVVSSHVLEEVERFGARVLVIAQGRLAAEGDFHQIRALMDDRPHRLRIGTDRPRELAAALLDVPGVVAVRLHDGVLLVDSDDAPALRAAIAPVARGLDARLTELVGLDDDLESVFRYLVERR